MAKGQTPFADGAATLDARLYSPSVARNREPILDGLRSRIPTGARVIELASGTGEHAVHCAGPLGVSLWQPSDPDPAARASIAAWRDSLADTAVAAPLDLDVTRPAWSEDLDGAPFQAVVSINMVHIAPWRAAEGLVSGAAACLSADGVLILYGPFKIDGRHTAPSNEVFDESLRARNATWGVRDLGDIEDLARANGFAAPEPQAMPANNFLVTIRRA